MENINSPHLFYVMEDLGMENRESNNETWNTFFFTLLKEQ